ncbi:MAG: diguanylate cyclase, partial [Bilophila sp.]
MQNGLVRRDLLELEQRLRDSLYGVLPFETHAVYFPQDTSATKRIPEWLEEERKLLLPLLWRGELLGVFMARNPDAAQVKALLPSLMNIATLCLENLELYKLGRLDVSTGLAARQVLVERLTQEVESIRGSFGRGFGESEDPHPHSGCMGLLVVRFSGLQDVTRNTSYGFADRLANKLAEAFSAALPDQTLAARTGDCEFAAFLPEGTRQQCETLADAILRRMEQIRMPDPYTGRQIGVQPHAGYALYPQDMDGTRQRDMEEQARMLLHRAGLAAEVARSRNGEFGREPIMGYGRLLHEGGRLRQILPLSRVLTSLGRSVGAREGQRFSVWSVHYAVQGTPPPQEERQPLYKGELVLLEVRESEAVAEILHLGDPAWPLEPGDDLTLLPEERSLTVQSTLEDEGTEEEKSGGISHRPDPLTGLLRHGDFLARLAKTGSDCDAFALALVHVDLNRTGASEDGGSAPLSANRETTQPDHIMAQVADVCRAGFASVSDAPVLGGRFGLNSLVFFHPNLHPDAVRTLYASVCAEAAERLGLRTGAGLACWPFLDFRPADMLECARKALEYALLLPAPHVGLFDSLAMNISADKRHCRGDVFGAIEEYKLALLADGDNALAWNSLGVCMASLGHHAEARRHFEEALLRTPDDPALAYNLGAVCQS